MTGARGPSPWPEVGLGPLGHLLADESVTEVMVNGPGRGRAYVERAGRLEPVEIDLGATEIERLIEQVVLPLGLRLDRASPMVEARLPGGSRLHAVIPPLAPDGPCLTIRRTSPRTFTLDDFQAGPAASAFLD
ncbi:MAG: ATPase, T2SS/T4P/T4SS family, partial [Acidimicrobiia bacterium]